MRPGGHNHPSLCSNQAPFSTSEGAPSKVKGYRLAHAWWQRLTSDLMQAVLPKHVIGSSLFGPQPLVMPQKTSLTACGMVKGRSSPVIGLWCYIVCVCWREWCVDISVALVSGRKADRQMQRMGAHGWVNRKGTKAAECRQTPSHRLNKHPCNVLHAK